MSMEKSLKEILDEILDEVQKELEEATTTGNVDGYQTPYAFSKGNKHKKRKKKIATQLGYSVVGDDIDNINEAKLNVRDLPNYIFDDPDDFEDWYDGGMELDKKGHKLAPFSKSDERKLFGFVEDWIESRDDNRYGSGSSSDIKRDIKDIEKFLKQKGKVIKESVNEAKAKRPVNRWLELKNDESMHPHKKMAMGLKELKYQLREVEKFFNWYNKIKTMNELDSQQYWKRTNRHIYTIKEKLIKIAKTIQEIEK